MYTLYLLTFSVTSVVTLSLEQVEEGDCPPTGYQPLSHENWQFVNNFTYIPAGSRHDLYGIASSHPRFWQMRESEIQDTMCLTHNATLPLGRGSPVGFGGRVLGTYYFGLRSNQSGVFDLSFVPTGKNAPLQNGTETITLSDYKTFAFFANCFTVNSKKLKSWKLLSQSSTLSVKTKRAIESHAVSLGFKRKNFLFLNYDGCEVGQSKEKLLEGSQNYLGRNSGLGWSK